MESDSHPGCTLICSCQWLPQHWRVTHTLDACSTIFVSGPNLLKDQGATHTLDGWSAILVSGSNLLKHWRTTHLLDLCSAILTSGSNLLKN